MKFEIFVLVWFLFGIYSSYRSLKYGFLSKQKTLSSEDVFMAYFVVPICGAFSFFLLYINDYLGYKSKTFKNYFYKKLL